jgi:hypothetical protein
MAKETPEQKFAKIFFASQHGGPETEGVRNNAEGRVNDWLKRHGKVRSDIPAILLQAARDAEAAKPPSPPPSDPRDSAPHPFDDPRFTPIALVDGLIAKYVTMPDHLRIILATWICFTHVYQQFAIAPRVAVVSEGPDSGKTIAKNVAKRLVLRPNPETGGTAAAITDFIDEGPCTVLIDELDHLDNENLQRFQLIWNFGHERGAMRSLMVRGRRKLVKLHAPMMAVGIGINNFLAPTQRSRTFVIDMAPYADDAAPERDFYAEEDFRDFDIMYSYLRQWGLRVKLNLKPDLSGLFRRNRDNARGLASVADACGPEWGRRVRAAITSMLAKEQAERPQLVMLRHGLVIFDGLGIDQIGSVQFNRELKQLDLPDANWTRFRGASGHDYEHPITLGEQVTLLKLVGVQASSLRFDSQGGRGGRGAQQRRGYRRSQFEEALRSSSSKRAHLRLITPQSDV